MCFSGLSLTKQFIWSFRLWHFNTAGHFVKNAIGAHFWKHGPIYIHEHVILYRCSHSNERLWMCFASNVRFMVKNCPINLVSRIGDQGRDVCECLRWWVWMTVILKMFLISLDLFVVLCSLYSNKKLWMLMASNVCFMVYKHPFTLEQLCSHLRHTWEWPKTGDNTQKKITFLNSVTKTFATKMLSLFDKKVVWSFRLSQFNTSGHFMKCIIGPQIWKRPSTPSQSCSQSHHTWEWPPTGENTQKINFLFRSVFDKKVHLKFQTLPFEHCWQFCEKCHSFPNRAKCGARMCGKKQNGVKTDNKFCVMLRFCRLPAKNKKGWIPQTGHQWIWGG